MLAISILVGLMLCFAQIIGNMMLILASLASFMLFVAWCSSCDFTLPVLLFFLPWSPIMKMNPNSFSWYTFGLVLVCVIGAIKKRFSLRKYQIVAGLVLLAVTLLSKLLDGSGLSFDYIAFMMMIVAFPVIREEDRKKKYDFTQIVLFFSLGIIIASMCAMFFSEYSNIRRFIKVDAYQTIIRRSGFYGDANFYVAHILAAMGGALSLTLQEKKRSKVIALVVTILFLLYCGFLSGSKSFVLVAAVVLLFWIIATLRLRGRMGLKIVLLSCFLGAAIFITTSALFGDLIDVIFTRFSGASDMDSLTTGRLGLWKSYVDEIFSDFKVFFLGRGFSNIKVNGRGSHNTIIQVFYQLGLLGVPALICWIVGFYRSGKYAGMKRKKFGLHQLMIFVGTFVPWLAIDAMFFDEFFLLQWYMLVALAQSGTPETAKASTRKIHLRLWKKR